MKSGGGSSIALLSVSLIGGEIFFLTRFNHTLEEPSRRKIFDSRPIRGFNAGRRSIQGREFPRTPTFENRKRRKTLFFVRPWGKLPEDGRM